MEISSTHTSFIAMASNTLQLVPRWYVLYGRYASINVIDELQYIKDKVEEINIDDFFVPIEMKKKTKDSNTTTRKTLFTGQYIFLKARKEAIVKLKHISHLRQTCDSCIHA